MRPLLTLATVLLLGCAVAPGGTQPLPVWVRSYNRSPVDVYLLCGDQNARWLGTIPEKGAEGLEVSPGETQCALGLNFFLVVQRSGRGYWVGPFRPARGTQVQLVIEKYAGLSSAQVHLDGR